MFSLLQTYCSAIRKKRTVLKKKSNEIKNKRGGYSSGLAQELCDERKTSFLLMRKLPQGKQAQPLTEVIAHLLVAYKHGTYDHL